MRVVRTFTRRKVDPVSRFFAIVPPSAHRSSVVLCHRPSGTGPRSGITPASPTSALATIAPGYPSLTQSTTMTPARTTAYLAWLRIACHALSAADMSLACWHATYGDMRGTHRWTCVTLVTSGGTRVRQAEPVGRRRRADHAGLVQHDGLARPRAVRLTGRRLRLRRARPVAIQRSCANCSRTVGDELFSHQDVFFP